MLSQDGMGGIYAPPEFRRNSFGGFRQDLELAQDRIQSALVRIDIAGCAVAFDASDSLQHVRQVEGIPAAGRRSVRVGSAESLSLKEQRPLPEYGLAKTMQPLFLHYVDPAAQRILKIGNQSTGEERGGIGAGLDKPPSSWRMFPRLTTVS